MNDKVKVSNMISDRSGREIANQFVIEVNTNRYFQSYSSIIVKIDINGKITLDTNKWDYSRTTGKYRNIFLGENKAETLKKIKSGEYALADLN